MNLALHLKNKHTHIHKKKLKTVFQITSMDQRSSGRKKWGMSDAERIGLQLQTYTLLQ